MVCPFPPGGGSSSGVRVAGYGSIAWTKTPVTLPGETFTYAAGPIVANNDGGSSNGCRTAGSGTRAEAEDVCSGDPGCEWLHDRNCDDADWRVCGSIQDPTTNAVVWTVTTTDTGSGCTRLKRPGPAGWWRWTGSRVIAAGSNYEWMDLYLQRTTRNLASDSGNVAW